jgi:hypothetical protein
MRTGVSCVALGLVVVGCCGCGNAGSAEAGSTTVTVNAAHPEPPDPGKPYPKGDPTPQPNAPWIDAGVPPPSPPGAPFSAPEREWTWIDTPENRCGDGSPTGVGVSLTKATDDVLFFLEGGGACWDASTCFGVVSTAFYIGGYGKNEFDTDPQRAPMLPLQLDNASNPFRGMNIIYIPYCTGDVHAGKRIATYQVNGEAKQAYHYGALNFEAVLKRAVATFPRAKRVWIAGDSAGGFGAALNFPRAFAAFPLARVGVLDDSGQPVQPAPDRWQAWKAAWGLEAPDGCAACDGDVGAYVDYYRAAYPDSRFGLISFLDDSVISSFMGLSAADFQSELDALTKRIDDWPYAGYFIIQGALHVGMLTANSPQLDTWLERLVSGDPAWTSVRPP